MHLLFAALVICCRIVCAAVPDEEFYILPMGQGNGQLVIYNTDQPGHKVGVLYDLGSKSLQTHPKFTMRGEWDIKFRPNSVRQALTEGSDFKKSVSTTPEKAPASLFMGTPQTTERKAADTQIKQIRSELQEFIQELLSGLKHLFIFVSHTDVDHINKFDATAIPANLSVTVFLCGDWFGDTCSSPNDQDTSSTVKKVLSFFAIRLNTYMEFPYYWGFSVEEKNFNKLIKEKLDSLSRGENIETVMRELIPLTSKLNYNAPCPRFFSGPFRDMLANTSIDLPDPNLRQAIDNIHIWSMNLPVSDVNDFSPIISCTLPSINLSVVLTGDAGVPVFQSIASIRGLNAEQDFRQIMSTPADHLVLLMLPHHGSWLNVGGEMLRFFKPNVFGVAAGDGGQHGHPSLKSIEWINRIYKTTSLDRVFAQRYTEASKYQIIAIREKTTSDMVARYPHTVVKMTQADPMFLCPNIYGCIKWNTTGIYTNFNNAIMLPGKGSYCVNYTSHVFEITSDITASTTGAVLQCDAISDPLRHTDLTYMESLNDEFLPYKYLLQDSTGLFYVGVPVDGKTFIYQLVTADTELTAAVANRKRDRE